MIQNYIGLPIFGANILMAAAIVAIIGFTTMQVLATVPAPAMTKPVKAASVINKEQHSGVVAWIARDSIKITDSYGVSRVFAITPDTSILKNGSKKTELEYADIKMLGHVRISSLDDGIEPRAEVIIVL